MAPHLVRQLESLGKDVRLESSRQGCDWAAVAEEVAEMTLSATHLFHRLEAAGARAQSSDPKAWNEAAARGFIPIFQEWFDYATELKELRKNCTIHGYPVEGGEAFLHAYNRSKIMAIHFNSVLEASRRIERGENTGRPLEEVMDELRGHSGS